MTSTIWILLSALSTGASSPVENDVAPGTCGTGLVVGGGHREYGARPSDDLVRVWGEPVEVPPLQVRAQDGKTGLPIQDGKLSVCYDWRWYRYPYPETLFGAWEIAYECRTCRLDSDGSATVPLHQVKPRGWYRGWLLFGRKPRFDGLRFEVSSQGYSHSLSNLPPQSLQQLKQGRIGEIRLQNAGIKVRIEALAATATEPVKLP